MILKEMRHMGSFGMSRSNVDASVEVVARAWKQSPYYANAEKWTYIFWRPDTVFRKLFSKLNLVSVIELACGHGRHAEQIASECGSLILIDVHVENIEVCKKRLSRNKNITYIVNNGYNFDGISDSSTSAIFCYDAMVHFSPDLVECYLKESSRVLIPGGMALFHHSNYAAPLDRPYGANPHSRNHMTFELFSKYADSAGLVVEESHPMSWGNEENLDRVTLLKKPY